MMKDRLTGFQVIYQRDLSLIGDTVEAATQ